jgi:hypothetical protein
MRLEMLFKRTINFIQIEILKIHQNIELIGKMVIYIYLNERKANHFFFGSFFYYFGCLIPKNYCNAGMD